MVVKRLAVYFFIVVVEFSIGYSILERNPAFLVILGLKFGAKSKLNQAMSLCLYFFVLFSAFLLEDMSMLWWELFFGCP